MASKKKAKAKAPGIKRGRKAAERPVVQFDAKALEGLVVDIEFAGDALARAISKHKAAREAVGKAGYNLRAVLEIVADRKLDDEKRAAKAEAAEVYRDTLEQYKAALVQFEPPAPLLDAGLAQPAPASNVVTLRPDAPAEAAIDGSVADPAANPTAGAETAAADTVDAPAGAEGPDPAADTDGPVLAADEADEPEDPEPAAPDTVYVSRPAMGGGLAGTNIAL